MAEKIRIQLPDRVNFILSRLRQHGHEAYAVGGCVRDIALGLDPKDWDITTSAKPEEVKVLFRRTIDTGIAHGTVTVMLGEEGFEVTTYRIDGKYEDARHPKEVTFTPNLSEDLKRRDFTINAMAYSPEDGLVDLFGGLEDLQKKEIRCVGNPEERFSEDALRMFRALRFAAQLGFHIEANTFSSIQKLSTLIERVSKERIATELIKLITSDHPEVMREVYRSKLCDSFLPEFSRMMETPQNNPHHCYSVGEHTIVAMKRICPTKVLRLAMLLHDVAKPVCRTTDFKGIDHFKGHPVLGEKMAKEILRRLRLDKDTIQKVCKLVRIHDERPPINQKAIRRAICRHGLDAYPYLFAVKRADMLAQSDYDKQKKLSLIDGNERIYYEILHHKECVQLKDLKITGSDLIREGMEPGPKIGKALQALLQVVLEHPEYNEKVYLLKIWKEWEDEL